MEDKQRNRVGYYSIIPSKILYNKEIKSKWEIIICMENNNKGNIKFISNYEIRDNILKNLTKKSKYLIEDILYDFNEN